MKKSYIAILLAVILLLTGITPADAKLAEMEGPIFLLKADVNPVGRDPSLLMLNIQLVNVLSEDIRDLHISLEDPENFVVNEDEIEADLDNFYGKTIKSYTFALRTETIEKAKQYPLFLEIRGPGFFQKIPFAVNYGPKGPIGYLYSPSSGIPIKALYNEAGNISLQLANKGDKPIENLHIEGYALDDALTLGKKTWKLDRIEPNQFEEIEIPFKTVEEDAEDFLPILLEMKYTIDKKTYAQSQYRVLDPSPASEDLGDSSNWNREQMRRAAGGEIPPSGGDIPDASAGDGGVSGGDIPADHIPADDIPDTGNAGGDGGWGGSSGGMRNKPKLIISKYNFSEKPIVAGETFQMELTFFNTNAHKTVQNIKIYLTSDAAMSPEGQGTPSSGGNVFTPVDSSNTFYIDSISPKSTVTKTITLSADVTAAAKNYTMVANFEYEDWEGNEFTAQEQIGIPVIQKSRLTSSEVYMQDMVFVGEPANVGIDFYNTGKVTLYNLFVNVEGDFRHSGQTQYFVGNFSSGSQDHYSVDVFLEEPGEHEGKIIFTYEDAAGNPQKEEKEFSIYGEEMIMPDPSEMDTMEPMPNQNTSIFKKPVTYIVAAVVAFVAYFIWRRKKKSDSEEKLNLNE